MGTRTLHLLRHAKSSWDDVSLDDHDRPLSKRGRRTAEAIAAHFVNESAPIEWVLGSTALRVRETVEPILAALKPTRVLFDRKLYLARSATLLDQLRKVDDGIAAVLLVGHNPGLHELALALAEARSLDALPTITGKFPTGALASFEIAASWRRLVPGDAKLLSYRSPRDFASADPASKA
jgi:phosphohistidine phosphatase